MESRLKEQISEIVDDRFTDDDKISNDELNRTIEFVVLVPETVKLTLDAKGIPPLNRDSSIRMMQLFGKWQPVLATSLEFTSRKNETSGDLDGFWRGGAVHKNQCMLIDQNGSLGLGKHWATLKLPSMKEWELLSQAAHTHLHPIIYIDLSKNPHLGGDFIASSKWIIGEAAIPLAKYLLNT